MRALRQALALAALLWGIWPAAGWAQTPPSVEQVMVSLWPEFDRAEVLVIYRLRLAADTALPVQVGIPLPPAVTNLNAVATRSQDGSLVNASYTQPTSGESNLVLVDSDSLEIQVEFYAPLERNGDQRSFTFLWPGGLKSAAFLFEVQEPAGATGLILVPASETQAPGEFGLVYHHVDVGPIEASATPSVAITYSRTTDQLTSEFLLQETPLGTPESLGGRTPDLVSYLPWALLVLGLILLAGGGIYYVRTTQRSRPSRPRHRRAASEDDSPMDASPVYCHNCGAHASASDRFCRQCGTPLRR